jgi:hypothetical protein
MATVAEIEAAIAKAEAAGRKDLADKLRAYLPATPPAPDAARIEAAIAKADAAGRKDLADKLRANLPAAPQEQPTVSTPARADPVAGTPEARQQGIDDFALFEMANPSLRGKFTPETMPKAGETIPGANARERVTVQPWKNVRPDTFGETAAAMMEGPVAGMKAFAGGVTGSNPSPSREFLANDPLTGGLPSPILTGLGAVGDAGGAALSALGAGISGAIGLGAEAVPGQSSADEKKLAEDVTGMTMFAVPELAGASSIPARMAATAPRVGSGVVDDAARAGNAAPSVPPVARAAAKVAETPEEIGALTRKAASGGMGSVKAQEELAAAARINPEAKAAADRLGIDLPADVFSDSETLRATVGLTRSEVGKEAEALWRSAVKNARDKADEIMAAMDGSPDIASVSDAVKGALQATQANLKSTAKSLYEAVDSAVPKAAPAQVSSIVKALNGVIQDLGGIKGMVPAERALYELVTNADQPVTYGRLLREKNLIGKAIARGDSPYSSMDQATLNRMYGAIAEDQLATVGALGDDALRLKLREANQLTAKQKALEKRIVAAFGSDLDGSIGARLKSAVVTAAKGDIAGLQRILKVIPEDLRQSATASAIAAATRSARATEPGFGLSEFSKVFGGIMTNRPVYNLIGKTLGSDAMSMLKDLQTVAQRIAIADSNVLRTGKANQALVGALTADSLVGRVLHSTAGERLTQAVAIGGGSAVGGPVGGMVAGPIASALMKGAPDKLAKAGKLFASDEFQRLAVEAAKGTPSPATIAAVKKSPAFLAWSKGMPSEVINDLFRSTATPTAGQAANTPAMTTYEPLWKRYGG